MGKKNKKDLVQKTPSHVVALYDHLPTEDDFFNNSEPSFVAPDTKVQLSMKKGQIFEVTGEIDWWLFVKYHDEAGYVPSYLMVPVKYDKLTADE